MECGARLRLSRFLKWIRRRSPTRARINGPGMSRLSELDAGAWGSERRQPVLNRWYTTVGKIASAESTGIPMIASRPLGATFHHVGTAATHTSTVLAFAVWAVRNV